MNTFNSSDIEPNKGIGPFIIGMSESSLFKIIPSNTPKIKIGEKYTVSFENYTIWVNKNKKISQIGVSKNFKGKLHGIELINIKAKDIESSLGKLSINSDFQLIINGITGVCLHVTPTINQFNQEIDNNTIIENVYVYN